MVKKTRPMAIHKSFWISYLKTHPEDLDRVFKVHEFKTAAQAIEYLEKAEEQYFIGPDFVVSVEEWERKNL